MRKRVEKKLPKRRRQMCFTFAAVLLTGCSTIPNNIASPQKDKIEALPATVYALDYRGDYNDQSYVKSANAIGGEELSNLLIVMRAGNFDIAQARARIDQARAAQKAAAGGRLPDLSYSFSAGPSRSLNFLSFQTEWEVGGNAALSSNWDLDIFGRLREDERAAFYTAEASKLTTRRLRQTLSAQLMQSYVTAWSLSEQIDITRALAESFEQSAELTNQRYRAGSGQVSALDIQITRQNALSTRANLPELEAQYKSQLYVIDALLGRVAGETDLSFGEIGQSLSLPDITAGLPADLLRRRVDVAAAELSLLAAYSDIHVAKAQRKPSLSLSGSLSQNALRIEDIFDLDTLAANVLASLAGPLFRGGQLKAGVELAQARAQELASAYGQTAYAAYSDVQTAIEFEQAYRQKLQQVQTALAAAELSDQIATERYSAGQASLLAVLETRRSLFSSRRELVTAKQQLLQARSDLLLALGGDIISSQSAASDFLEDQPQQEFSSDLNLISKAKEAFSK